jgi:hypothetical protein
LILLVGINLSDAVLLCIDMSKDVYYKNKVGELSILLILCFFPLLLIAICTVIICSVLVIRKSSAVTSRRRHMTKFTRLSLAAGIFHCVCVLPIMFTNLIWYGYIEIKFTSLYQALIFYSLASIFLYMNNTFNFIIYSLSSKDFQEDMKTLLNSLRHRE